MIAPTIGRRVWYWPGQAGLGFSYFPEAAQPCDAGICFVHNDRKVNLSVADHRGAIHPVENVMLLQDDDEAPAGRAYAQWMPYQTGQAKKEGAKVEQPITWDEAEQIRSATVAATISGMNPFDTATRLVEAFRHITQQQSLPSKGD